MTDKVAEIAATLTKAQAVAMKRIDDRVYSLRELHHATRKALYEKGLLANIRAAGHQFFKWTVLGNQVRNYITQEDRNA